MIKEIFTDPKIRTYRYKNLRPFKMSLAIDGELVEQDGDVPLNLVTAWYQEETAERSKEARESSVARPEEIFWVTQFDDEIHRLIYELFRSKEMISTHERLASQGKLTPEEASCLAEEKVRRDKNHRTLRAKLSEALQAGTGFFRGVQHDGSSLGQSLQEIFHSLLDIVIPHLYPKLEMGIRPLKGDESEKFLTAANLNGLPPLFYDGEDGLCLVTKEGAKYVPNLSADICKEILSYLIKEYKYGNNHFQGMGYGWDRDVIQLVLAVLLRGGAVEVTYQGRKYRNHTDPACRIPFTKVPAFRKASFAPREPIDLHTLADAARHYEEITGKEVDIEEGAIASAFKKLASQDKELLLPLVAKMKALDLPGAESMEAFLQTVEGILDMPPDDCVKTLAGEGKTYKELRSQALQLAEATSKENLEIIKNAGNAIKNIWPIVAERTDDEKLKEKAEELSSLLASEAFYKSIEAIRQASDYVFEAYAKLYGKIHQERTNIYDEAIQAIKGMPEWAIIAQDPAVSTQEQEAIIRPLLARACHDLDLHESAIACTTCKASIAQMETDIAAKDAIVDQAIKKLQQTAAPGEQIERVRVSKFLAGKLETPEDVEAAVNELKAYLLKLIASGTKIVLE
ncbi:MAG: hypothetical protein JRI39_13475 [Deltaproteobacteria bacterium]|nr:hypothetical protein [Deltaproteobacteria bacterium]